MSQNDRSEITAGLIATGFLTGEPAGNTSSGEASTYAPASGDKPETNQMFYPRFGGRTLALITLATGVFHNTCQASTVASTVYVSIVDGALAGAVHAFTSSGTDSLFAPPTFGATSPQVLTLDGAGNLYVTEPGASQILKFTPGGTQSVYASLGDGTGSEYLSGLAFGANGNLYVSEAATGKIEQVTPGGVVSDFMTGLANPKYITSDGHGNLFLNINGSTGAFGGGDIARITPDGTISTFAANAGGTAMAFDSSGNLFVGQTPFDENVITKFTPGGISSVVTTIAGGRTAGMGFDRADNLFVINRDQVLEITPGGTTSVFATGLTAASGLAVAPTPEPATGAVLGGGLVMLFLARRKALRNRP